MVTREVARNLIASAFIKDKESLLTTRIFSYYTQKDKAGDVQTLVQGETTEGWMGLFRSVKQQNLPQQSKSGLSPGTLNFRLPCHACNGKVNFCEPQETGTVQLLWIIVRGGNS